MFSKFPNRGTPTAAFVGPIKPHKVLNNEGFIVGVHKISRWLQDQDVSGEHAR